MGPAVTWLVTQVSEVSMSEGGESDENGTRTFDPESHWDECSGYPVKDWQHEVAEDSTRLGYREWVNHQIEMNQDDEQKKDEP